MDFFAGSGTTARVAIETGRNSITSDIDQQFPKYLRQHLQQMEGTAAIVAAPNYHLIGLDESYCHPVFRGDLTPGSPPPPGANQPQGSLNFADRAQM
jgi:site-specific DNA-methyltransferase (adenine-specific)